MCCEATKCLDKLPVCDGGHQHTISFPEYCMQCETVWFVSPVGLQLAAGHTLSFSIDSYTALQSVGVVCDLGVRMDSELT